MTKPTITKRSVKGAALTYTELDDNFQNLQDATVSLTAGTGGTQVTADLNGNITLIAGTGVTLTGDNTAKTITIDSTAGSNNFGTIAVSGQSNVVADSTSDTLTLVAGTGISLTTNATSDSVTITSTATAQNAFSTIAVSGQSNVVADSSSDTLTIAAGSGISITTNASTDTVTIASSGNITLNNNLNTNSYTIYDSTSDAIRLAEQYVSIGSGTAGSTGYLTTPNSNTIVSLNTAAGGSASSSITIRGSTATSPDNITISTNASGIIYLDGPVSASDYISVPSTTSVVSGSSTDKYISIGSHGQIFDDGNFHIHTNAGTLWLNSLDSSDIKLGTQYNTGSGSDVYVGKNLSVTGTASATQITANSSTAFIAGSAAISGVALQIPEEGSIRNLYNGDNSIYYDVSIGGTTDGHHVFRGTSSYSQYAKIDNNGIQAITSYVAKTSWNAAIDTELTVDDYRFRVHSSTGIFPEIISNTSGTKNTAWTAVATMNGYAITQLGNTGTFIANNAWSILFNGHGMDASGDTIVVALQDKAQGRIYRITFMRSDNGSSTGYNIIAERLL